MEKVESNVGAAASVGQYLLTPGSIAVLPTDTVYGVVARAHDQAAVTRLYELKRRENKPGTLVAASIDQFVELGIKRKYLTAVEQFWPGAVSVVVPVGPDLAYIHQGKGDLAVRIPNSPALLAILEQTGPLVTSSANQPGEPTSTTIEQAQAYFGDAVEWYEDAGEINGDPSTVIRVIDDAIEILRQGAVDIKENE